MRRLLLFTVLLLAGCQPPFGPQTLVDRLRILGMRAEPPEVGLNDQVVRLEALVADGGGRATGLECTWAVCLIDIGWAAGNIDCPGDDSWVFSNDCDAAVLDLVGLIAWLAEQGWDAQALEQLPAGVGEEMVPLFVGLEVRRGAARERGIKRLRLNLEGDEPNRNPQLLGLEVTSGPEPGGELVPGDEVSLRPLVDAQSRQSYPDPEDGSSRREDLMFSWYSTAGEFRERRTIQDVDSSGRPLDENTWILTPEYTPAGTAHLWVVVRDGRWGSDWIEVEYRVAGE